MYLYIHSPQSQSTLNAQTPKPYSSNPSSESLQAQDFRDSIEGLLRVAAHSALGFIGHLIHPQSLGCLLLPVLLPFLVFAKFVRKSHSFLLSCRSSVHGVGFETQFFSTTIGLDQKLCQTRILKHVEHQDHEYFVYVVILVASH